MEHAQNETFCVILLWILCSFSFKESTLLRWWATTLWMKLISVDLAGCKCHHGCVAGDVTAEREEVESCSPPPLSTLLHSQTRTGNAGQNQWEDLKRGTCFFCLRHVKLLFLPQTWKSQTMTWRGRPREGGEGDGGGAATQVGPARAVWLTLIQISTGCSVTILQPSARHCGSWCGVGCCEPEVNGTLRHITSI